MIKKEIFLVALVIPIVSGTCSEGHFLEANSTCRKCSPCPAGQVVKEKCKGKNDTRCDCPQGQYLNHLKYECIDCKRAKIGEIYLKPCSEFANAETVACGKERFSNDSRVCYDCSRCTNGRDLEKNCSLHADTICKQSLTKDGGNKNALAIGLAVGLPILAIIIICIIAFLILRRRRHANRNNNSEYGLGRKQPEGSLTANTSVNSLLAIQPGRYANGGKPDYQRCSSKTSVQEFPVALGNRGGEAATITGLQKKWRVTQMQALSSLEREELSKILLPAHAFGNWISLACKLGFSNQEVKLIEMTDNPVCHMLRSYEGKANASLPNLYAALVDIPRVDALHIFNNFFV